MFVIVENDEDLQSHYKEPVLIICDVERPYFDLTVESSLICLNYTALQSVKVGGSATFLGNTNIGKSLEIYDDLLAHSDLIVEGDLIIESGYAIATVLEVDGNVVVNRGLVAYEVEIGGDFISNNEVYIDNYIEVGKNADIKRKLCVRKYVTVGGSLIVNDYLVVDSNNVKCKELRTRGILPENGYWAAFPPFKNLKNKLLNNEISCEDMWKFLSDDEINEILSWDGWSPLQRAQLKMYFGRCISVPGNELVVK